MYRACDLLIDYAAPVFFNGLPQYLKNELVRLEKRAISIITRGKCNSAIEVVGGGNTHFGASLRTM